MHWWTEIETDSPDIAAGCTGVIVPYCKYRIEWTFAAVSADQIVKDGERRFCKPYPSAIEYQNLIPVQRHECAVVKL